MHNAFTAAFCILPMLYLCLVHVPQVAYHWWKELPKDQLRKSDSVVSEQQAWADMGPDKPLLAKPSVRYRKTINIDQMTPEGMEYQVTVNAQHYAVLVTDVQPCCPYPDMEQ